MNNIVKLNPTVCIVGNTYQIMTITQRDAMVSVRVGNNVYYNHSNGIRVSSAGVHRVSVPSDELDNACKYTVVVEEMLERKPYFPKISPAIEMTYNFSPIEKTNDINIYHLADVHGHFDQAVDAVRFCGEAIDLLIMNGDIANSSNTAEDLMLCYKIASEVTKGEIPCIISRGNHDLRGPEAENLAKYMPSDNGKTYYTFKAGCIWGMLVDAGEDKDDSHPEYGGAICCHDFRLEQEKMIKNTIENASNEYDRDDIKYKLIISHIPFPFKREAPFDIEKQLYSNWSELIRENINPDIMICGHTHKACISECGSEYDELGQPCTIIVGSDVDEDNNGKFILSGALITLSDGVAKVRLNSGTKVLFEETVSL